MRTRIALAVSVFGLLVFIFFVHPTTTLDPTYAGRRLSQTLASLNQPGTYTPGGTYARGLGIDLTLRSIDPKGVEALGRWVLRSDFQESREYADLYGHVPGG